MRTNKSCFSYGRSRTMEVKTVARDAPKLLHDMLPFFNHSLSEWMLECKCEQCNDELQWHVPLLVRPF